MSREAMKQALKALETNNEAWKQLADSGDAGFWEAEEQPFYELSVKAITALRQALEEKPGPTAWRCQCGKAYTLTCISSKPAKQWVSLTDEEVWEAIDDVLEGGGWLDVARALEAAIKRKNT